MRVAERANVLPNQTGNGSKAAADHTAFFKILRFILDLVYFEGTTVSLAICVAHEEATLARNSRSVARHDPLVACQPAQKTPNAGCSNLRTIFRSDRVRHLDESIFHSLGAQAASSVCLPMARAAKPAINATKRRAIMGVCKKRFGGCSHSISRELWQGGGVETVDVADGVSGKRSIAGHRAFLHCMEH